MSETNKNIVDKINAAFAEGSTEGFLEHCSEDIVWTMAGQPANQGKGTIREWMGSHDDSSDPPVFSQKMLIAEEETVVCWGDMTMHDAEGKEGNYAYCDIYTFSEGKVTNLLSHLNKYQS